MASGQIAAYVTFHLFTWKWLVVSGELLWIV